MSTILSNSFPPIRLLSCNLNHTGHGLSGWSTITLALLGYQYTPDEVTTLRFFYLVRNGGQYDLKNQPDWQHDEFIYNGEIVDKDVPGNILYGYLGKAMGFRDDTLYTAAGLAQIRAGTSKPEWQNNIYYGDDPRDHARIMQGIEIYNTSH